MCWRLAGLGPEGFVTAVLYPGEGESRVWAGTQHGPLAGLSFSVLFPGLVYLEIPRIPCTH